MTGGLQSVGRAGRKAARSSVPYLLALLPVLHGSPKVLSPVCLSQLRLTEQDTARSNPLPGLQQDDKGQDSGGGWGLRATLPSFQEQRNRGAGRGLAVGSPVGGNLDRLPQVGAVPGRQAKSY